MDAALEARDAELSRSGAELTSARESLEERDALLRRRGAEVQRAAARVHELERVTRELARRVVERERELRTARLELGERSGEGEPAVANGAELFDGLIEVEIGPFADFAQLVGFEDAANGIDGAVQISVKRFAKGRATLEVQLDEPVELLRELEGRAPFEFHVRDTRADRLILDLDSE